MRVAIANTSVSELFLLTKREGGISNRFFVHMPVARLAPNAVVLTLLLKPCCAVLRCAAL